MNQREKQAFEYCEQLARTHYENFPVASWFVAPAKRRYVWAVYAFARTADDFADELKDPQQSLQQLAEWDAKLEAAVAGKPEDPIFVAVQATLRDCQLPVNLLHDLVQAFRMDVTKNRFADFEELLQYCRYSANPVGRLVLLIHGYRDPGLLEWSDKICSALQLTNFWQDVSVDVQKNRIYLPQSLFKKHGYSEEDLFKKVYDQRWQSLLKEAIAFTRDLFYQGSALMPALRKDLRMEIKLTWQGGMKILEKMETLNYHVLHTRPTLNWHDKISIFIGAILSRFHPLPSGAAHYAST